MMKDHSEKAEEEQLSDSEEKKLLTLTVSSIATLHHRHLIAPETSLMNPLSSCFYPLSSASLSLVAQASSKVTFEEDRRGAGIEEVGTLNMTSTTTDAGVELVVGVNSMRELLMNTLETIERISGWTEEAVLVSALILFATINRVSATGYL